MKAPPHLLISNKKIRFSVILMSVFSDTIVSVVADPNELEAYVSTGQITFSLNRQGELLSLTKLGGLSVDPDTINNHCLQLAKARVVALDDELIAQLRK